MTEAWSCDRFQPEMGTADRQNTAKKILEKSPLAQVYFFCTGLIYSFFKWGYPLGVALGVKGVKGVYCSF